MKETDETTEPTEPTEATEPMRAVAHTHPHTNETFGQVYRRGPAAADGGEAPERRADEDRAREACEGGETRMRDVDHSPPDGDGARAVWERGGEVAPEEGAPEEGAPEEAGSDRTVVADE